MFQADEVILMSVASRQKKLQYHKQNLSMPKIIPPYVRSAKEQIVQRDVITKVSTLQRLGLSVFQPEGAIA